MYKKPHGGDKLPRDIIKIVSFFVFAWGLLLSQAIAFPALAVENISLAQAGKVIALKEFPGYAVKREGDKILMTHAGTSKTITTVPFAPSAGKWPDLIVHDFDLDGVPEFLVLAAENPTDSLYYLRHFKHGQGRANYLFYDGSSFLFANPQIDAKKRTITSSTSEGYGVMYVWRKPLKKDNLQYGAERRFGPPLKELTPREQELAVFFSVAESDGEKRLPPSIYSRMPVETPFSLLPGAPIPEGNLKTPGSGYKAVPVGMHAGSRVTPDYRWFRINEDYLHGYVPTYRLFLETNAAVTLSAELEGANPAPDSSTCSAKLAAGTPVLMLDRKKGDSGQDWSLVYTACGLQGWVKSGSLKPREK